MIRALPTLILAAPVLGGCAKSPLNGSTGRFARLSFHFTMAEAVNPKYVYAVAIRPLNAAEYVTSDGLGPDPLAGYNRNGIVTGRPTLLIEYTPFAQSQSGYQVFRFENPPADVSDPDPGTPSLTGEVLTGSGLDPTVLGNDPKSLGFDITTQDLVDSTHPADEIVGIEFNILTMDETATNSASVSSRHYDALGDQRSLSSYDSPRRIRVDTSQRYDNTGSDGGQAASIPEPSGDVAPNSNDPTIDIIDYTVDVKTP